MDDGDEDHSTDRRSGEAVEEAAAQDVQFEEDPATQNRADQTENDVCDATIARAARDFSGEPAGDQADQYPADQALLPLDHNDSILEKMQEKCREHSASSSGHLEAAVDSMRIVAVEDRKYQQFTGREAGLSAPRGRCGTPRAYRLSILGPPSLRSFETPNLNGCSAAAGSCSGACQGPTRDRDRRCPRPRGRGI